VCARSPGRDLLRKSAGLRRCRSGSTAVDFALICPVFFAALFGVAQFGWAFLCGHSVRSALQKEARLLIANPSTTAATIKTAILSDLKNLVSPTIAVTVTSQVLGGKTVKQVSCVYTHQVLFPFAPSVTLDFSASAYVPVGP
jgi:Flp pilus assembly protein TadG